MIALNTFHRAGRIVIEVSDDGTGIDAEKVRRNAIERGLIVPESQMSDEQLRLLIFEPGFSTKEKAPELLQLRALRLDLVEDGDAPVGLFPTRGEVPIADGLHVA